MGRVRPFRREDIPAMVALRRRMFRSSEQPSPEALADYVEGIFFRSPVADPDLPSLVYEGDDGQFVGFLGVTARPMHFQGRRLLATVTTQFMVDPEIRSFAAFELLRHHMAGPQDLSLADLARDTSRKVWDAVGGTTSLLHSIYWERSLAPLRCTLSRPAAGRVAHATLRLASPLVTLTDWVRAGRHLPAPQPLPSVEGAALGEMLSAVVSDRTLHPEYEPALATWLLEQLRQRRPTLLRSGVVTDEGGGTAGWYLYLSTDDETGNVVQLAAAPAHVSRVFRACCTDAYHAGLARLEGRLDPLWLDTLAAEGCELNRRGPWTLVHSRDPEVVKAVLTGRAWLSRLDGEWWMNF